MDNELQDWIDRGSEVFQSARPSGFINCSCLECREHEATLSKTDVSSLTMKEVGRPGWSALCMASVDGKKHFLPAMIRLALSEKHAGDALEMLLLITSGIHGDDGRLLEACNPSQRHFVRDFLAYFIDRKTDLIDRYELADEVLAAHALWSKEADAVAV